MIMKTRYILFAAATLALAACSKTSEQPEPDGIQMTFRAYQESSRETKTTVQNSGTQVYWELADEIKVFFKGTGSRFVSQNTAEATVADFSGSLNILIGANEGANSITKIFGLYPYRADAVSDGSSVTTTLPAEQTGRVGSFAKNTHISLAATNANSVDLGFYNVTGGLRFSLTQEGIKSVTFEGNNGEALAGKIKLAFESGIPVIKEVSESSSALTLNAPGGGSFQTGQWYYIEAIPGTLTKGFKMVFSKGNETAKLNSSGSVTIGRGKYGSLADADEGLIFKESGSGDGPDPSSVIQFADLTAKYACVEKFDTNGDGEVSYEEAAAATSLSGLFTNWNTVTSFDEIKYFTGVTSTKNVFDGCSKLESIVIPGFITTLGAFVNCSSLKSVVLPSGIRSIPNNCFNGCVALESVALPAGVTSIGSAAFYGCSKLTGIELPTGLKTLGGSAFQNCSSLKTIDFPSSLTSVGSSAFQSCTALTNVSIPNGASIGASAFEGCRALKSVVLPTGLTSIPDSCFKDCTALTTITWPSNLTSIGNYAFSICQFEANDYTLELPASVTSIGSLCFSSNLHHLIIPSNSPVSIQNDSFRKDYTFLYVPAGMVEMYKIRTNWSAYADWIRPIGDYPSTITVGGSVAEAVDLGLSVKWASWNVGATKPEEYGDYFAWGETKPKWDYDWSTYKFELGTDNNGPFSKYVTKSNYNYGTVDNKTVLDLEDDAAHVNWGGSWRMPTDAEWTELRTKCTWTRTTQNGVNGRTVTGPNGNSIFLPYAGHRSGSSLVNYEPDGRYWSSSLDTGNPSYAYYVYSYSGRVSREHFSRIDGLSVRAVSE